MSTLFYAIAGIVIIALVIWFAMSRKKGGPIVPKSPEGPTPPPEGPAV